MTNPGSGVEIATQPKKKIECCGACGGLDMRQKTVVSGSIRFWCKIKKEWKSAPDWCETFSPLVGSASDYE